MRHLISTAILSGIFLGSAWAGERPYSIAGTGQTGCYDNHGAASCPLAKEAPFWGQDGQRPSSAPSYRDNGDGTVFDPVTGLMWEKGFRKLGFAEAEAEAAKARTGGHADWRVPTIKELYSLIRFDGSTGRGWPGQTGAPADARPYLDTRAFAFEYPAQGRFIDAQYLTRTAYVGTVMGGEKAFFGVNFADGRIKGYPQNGGPGRRVWYARFVRGNPDYGRNDFADNGDGTVSDRATGLTWTQADSGDGVFRDAMAGTARRDGRLDWREALAFCSGLNFAGRTDWRLPTAKELHSIVDYSRAPDVTNSAAIAQVFAITAMTDDLGRRDWPYAWTSTTHLDGRVMGDFAVYIAFGRAGGWMGRRGGPGGGGFGPPPGGAPMGGPGFGRPGPEEQGEMRLLDVHGAGAQRSSPKSGDESRLPRGAGPQGDVLRIYNTARCVRGGS
ncbi:hypothetical protein CCC_00711 [Paramagnetospirillum magnetotacticum MS-1]|uniref:Lcl C-terminal domain-containing protein n=1 Tax=Paramagnetospirillum magnetotacticum MS-1 TaxID=272627 RepID=A0A0C2YSG9_PARME|nr:DUF1566 domain-containing protein [Paramagnetospirillum magnetotacticum]KIL97650.1 hypothetical protein CCC_00711 [Paramagnetospirillum magnetotacticum MS-1]